MKPSIIANVDNRHSPSTAAQDFPRPKIYIYPLPEHLNTATVLRHPSQQLDFWYVEYLFHQNVVHSDLVTTDPDTADFLLIPFYPACYFAAFAYEQGIDPARWTRFQRYRSEFHVHCGFRETMRLVRKTSSWKKWEGRHHLLVFGQGRGANSGYFWQWYGSRVRHCTFLGVEARPGFNHDAFRIGHDVVIPGYTPWQDVIDEVATENLPRDILIHFRGRSWGTIRPEIFRHLRASSDIILEGHVSFAMGGENRPANRADVAAYYRELHRTVFCLCPAGWTPWSKRIYETILCGAIPVFIPGSFVPPFTNQLDFEKFSVTIKADELPRLEQILRSIPTARVQEMLAEVARVRHHFIWHTQSIPGDAFDLVCRDLIDNVSR
ncbi:MAG: glycosyltransferase family 47 protein [Planctomycetota bacterium]